MHTLVKWFQDRYPAHCKALIACQHNFNMDDLNPYHLESDCWSHTLMVCKIAELEKFDKCVQIAALLHDIGKPFTREVNPNNNHVRFFGHEAMSAYLAIEVLYKMMNEKLINKAEFAEIFALIALHSIFHKQEQAHMLFKKFQYCKKMYTRLIELNKCDALGRFCEKAPHSNEKTKSLVNISKNMQEKENTKSDSPYVELLCGISNSGKSTYISKQLLEESNIVVLSRDALVLKYGKGETYTTAWASLGKNTHKRIDDALNQQYLNALSEQKNIIVDMTNLSVHSRKRWLAPLPAEYHSRLRLFMTPMSLIKERAHLQSDKKAIGMDVIEAMVRRFEYPLYDEVESIRYEFIVK